MDSDSATTRRSGRLRLRRTITGLFPLPRRASQPHITRSSTVHPLAHARHRGNKRRTHNIEADDSTITPDDDNTSNSTSTLPSPSHPVSSADPRALHAALQQARDASLHADARPRSLSLSLSLSPSASSRPWGGRVVRAENTRLRARVSALHMVEVEARTLRDKVSSLEWALDAVRADADRVRDDALALCAHLDDYPAPEPYRGDHDPGVGTP